MSVPVEKLTTQQLAGSLRSTVCPACGGAKKRRCRCAPAPCALPEDLRLSLFRRPDARYRDVVASALGLLGRTEFRFWPAGRIDMSNDNNGVEKVLVSESTRRDARVVPSSGDNEKVSLEHLERERLEREEEQLRVEQFHLEKELSEINRVLKGSKRRMTHSQYSELTFKRQELLDGIVRIKSRCAAYRPRLWELRRKNTGTDKPWGKVLEELLLEVRLLRSLISEKLRKDGD